MRDCERLLGNQGGGDRDYLATLTLPSHVGWKGREYVNCPISTTTSCLPPTLVERREKAPMPPWRLSPLIRLQVVVNRIRPGCGGRAAMVESLGGRAVQSRLGLSASVTNSRASWVGRSTAAQDALVPLVGCPTKPVEARPAAWGPIRFFLLT